MPTSEDVSHTSVVLIADGGSENDESFDSTGVSGLSLSPPIDALLVVQPPPFQDR